jgi:hypothetical protein
MLGGFTGTASSITSQMEKTLRVSSPLYDDERYRRADHGHARKEPHDCSSKLLTTTGKVHDGRIILYRASTRDCGFVPLRRGNQHARTGS